MGARDRTSEILDIKKRNPSDHGYLSYELMALKRQWDKTEKDLSSSPDFYIIRAVTILEVSTRQEIALLINQGKEFTNRAVEFSKNFKMDFATVRDVQGRTITLGDILAHSIPINTFGQILSYFETLLGKPLSPMLMCVVERARTEMQGLPPKPIITDLDSVKNKLNRLFEIRHILCHELPQKPIYTRSDVDVFLDSAIQFTKAIEEILAFEKFGLVPLTQSGMNIAAGEKLKSKQEELDLLLIAIRAHLANHDRLLDGLMPVDSNLLSYFNDSQEKWVEYRKANCDWVAGMYRGGSIYPLIWASEGTGITESRIAELQAWFDHECSF